MEKKEITDIIENYMKCRICEHSILGGEGEVFCEPYQENIDEYDDTYHEYDSIDEYCMSNDYKFYKMDYSMDIAIDQLHKKIEAMCSPKSIVE